MSNIFTSELLKSYALANATAGIGEWVERNGEAAMAINPNAFYKNLDNGTLSGALRNEFQPNTSYVIDMWIDADDVISGGANHEGGMTVHFTDNTTESFVFIGPTGWNHKKIITDASKSIDRISFYYYAGISVFYRWDSYISPVDENSKVNVQKTGVFNSAQVIENQNLASIAKGGSAYCDNFYEY